MFDSTLRKNGQRCVHVAQRRHALRRALRAPRRARPRPRCRNRTSPASISRHWPQLNTQGIARRSSMRCDGRARRRPAADVELGDLRDRRRRAEIRHETPAFRRPARDRRLNAVRGQRVHRVVKAAARDRRRRDRRSSVASSVAATSVSRLRRPSSGSEYLLAMISPCSVMRMAPFDAAGGLREDRLVARAAAAADGAAAAVEQAQLDVEARETRRPAAARRDTAPSWPSRSRRPCCCPNSRASLPASRRGSRASAGSTAGETPRA